MFTPHPPVRRRQRKPLDWRSAVTWLLLFSFSLLSLSAWAGPDTSSIPFDVPIQFSTGSGNADSCSASGPQNYGTSVVSPASSTIACQQTKGGTVSKSSTPTSQDITQFIKGFVVGLLKGLVQQVEGIFGLLLHIGSLYQLAKALVVNTGPTLQAIAQALGKQLTTITHVQKELVCDPYSGAKLTGETLIMVLATVADGAGVAHDLDHIAEDLKQITEKAADDPLVLQTAKRAEELGEGLSDGKRVLLTSAQFAKDKLIGDIGEGYIAGELKKEGYTEFVYLQNSSGHGVDIIAHNPDTGDTMSVEVKTTRNASKTSVPLTGDQRTLGGKDYTSDRIETLESQIKAGRKGAVSQEDINKVRGWIDKSRKNGSMKYQKTLVHVQRDGQTGLVQAKNVTGFQDW